MKKKILLIWYCFVINYSNNKLVIINTFLTDKTDLKAYSYLSA